MQRIRLSRLSPGYILLVAGVLRMAYLMISGKLYETEYWEYGQIATQLLAGKGYSFPFVDENLNFLIHQVYPSALMPPGYVFFLLPFLLIGDAFIRNLLLFLVQTALSLLAMQLVFRWSERRFSREIALLILLLQAFYPELIYAVGTVGPTVCFHLLFAGFLYCISEKKHAVITGLIAGIMVLMRTETLLPAGFILLSDFLQGRKKQVLLCAITILASLFPWMLRNQLQFGKPLLSANAGVNFYRGNNAGEIGDWPVQPKESERRLRENPVEYEQKSDSLALQASVDWISANPGKFLRRLPEKFLRFWWIDWSDERTHHPAYYLPWIICLPLGLAGLMLRRFRDLRQLLLLFGAYTLIILIFFPQPRYASLIRFFWMIPSGMGLWIFLETWLKKPSD